MGVPYFFKHVTHSYNDITLDAKTGVDLGIEYLFFDMNCLIHPCLRQVCNENTNLLREHLALTSHESPSRLELALYAFLEVRLEEMIQLVNPTKCIYLAVDGVAPRAKMEQQRIRRFRSVLERDMTSKLYALYGKEYLSFDTNCVTPGTMFMQHLGVFLQSYTQRQRLKYPYLMHCLSDSNVPGEGEHKLIVYIREQLLNGVMTPDKSVVCIYGLDADLIMLSLALDVQSTFLLREKLSSTPRQKSKEEKVVALRGIKKKEKPPVAYHFFNVGEFTEQLTANFGDSQQPRRCAIDYVVMCFVFGNDFLHPLIGFDLCNAKSVNHLLKVYRQVFSEDAFANAFLVNVDGTLNFVFLKRVFELFQQSESTFLSDLQHKITTRRARLNQTNTYLELALEQLKFYPLFHESINALIPTTHKLDIPTFSYTDAHWESQYYDFYDVSVKDRGHVIAREYLKGLLWNSVYYTKGCMDVTYAYPYRASPTITDILNYLTEFPDANNVGSFNTNALHVSPLEQLLRVLPFESASVLIPNFNLLQHANLEHALTMTLDIGHKLYLSECSKK